MEARPDLPATFAVRLRGVRGIDCESVQSQNIASHVELPNNISLIVLSTSYLIFDFSGRVEYCGGATPAINFGPISSKYTEATDSRLALMYDRVQYMSAYLSTLWMGSQSMNFGLVVQPDPTPATVLWADSPHGAGWHFRAVEYLSEEPAPPQLLSCVAFEKAAATFHAIYGRLGERSEQLLALMNRCSNLYSSHDFSSCLLVSWSIIEAAQNIMWSKFLDKVSSDIKGFTSINKDRRKKLEGRDYTASVKSQLLSLSNNLPDDLLNSFDAIRNARNRFAHELKPVSANDAVNALMTAARSIAEVSETDFRVSASLRYAS